MNYIYLAAFNILDNNFRIAFENYILLKDSEVEEFEDIFLYSGLEFKLLNFYTANDIKVSQNLKNITLFKSRRSLNNILEAKNIANLLAKNSIKYAFLKGVAFNFYNFTKINERSFSDIDILINEEDMDSVIQILLKARYRFSNKFIVNRKELVGSLDKNGDIGMYSPNNQLIELHTKLINGSNEESIKFKNEVLQNTLCLNFGNTDISIISHENYILHIINNYTLQSMFSSGIRYVYDIIEINKNINIDWDILYVQSLKYGINKPFKLTIDLCNYFKKDLLDYKDINFRIDDGILKDAIELSFNNRYSSNYIGIVKNKRISFTQSLLKILMVSSSEISYYFNIRNNIFNYCFFYPIFIILRFYSIYDKVNKMKHYPVKKFQKVKLENVLNFLHE